MRKLRSSKKIKILKIEPILRVENTLFSITKEAVFFPYFYHEIIFYSTELFDCAVNVKFYLNVFIILNVNTNQTSREQYLNEETATYFGISCRKKFGIKAFYGCF